jgi:hypothetical protein
MQKTRTTYNSYRRRTFVTLSYRRGMKPLDIMKITGTKITTLHKVLQMDEIDVNETFFDAWEELKPKYKTEEVVKSL